MLSLLVLSSSLLGCGGKDGASSTVSGQPASAPPGTSTASVPTTATPKPGPTASATATATTPAPTATAPAPTQTATTGEPGGAGAGDEQPARTPAAFLLGSAGLSPAKVTAAAFLAIDVSITSKSGPHKVTIDAPGGGTFDVAGGGTRHVLLDGLKPGDYAITTDTGAKATLHVVSGGAPGP